MKKLITILVSIALVATLAAPVAYADGRHHHYRPHVRFHGHSHSGDHFWFGLGVGVLTSAIVSSLYYSPPPPPSRVVYVEPQTVVVQPSPRVYVTPERKFGTPLPATYGQVTVTPSALNMRSGPGVEHDVTGRLNKGDVLDVINSAPGWFYVRSPDGSYGWVMDQYTAPTQPVG